MWQRKYTIKSDLRKVAHSYEFEIIYRILIRNPHLLHFPIQIGSLIRLFFCRFFCIIGKRNDVSCMVCGFIRRQMPDNLSVNLDVNKMPSCGLIVAYPHRHFYIENLCCVLDYTVGFTFYRIIGSFCCCHLKRVINTV